MNFEEQLGIKLSAFIAGIVGGIVSLTFEERLSFFRAVVLIFSGGATAGYMFKGAEVYMQTKPGLAGVFGFAIGLIAMKLIGILIQVVDQAKLIVTQLLYQVKQDPTILLSYAKIILALKNGTNNNPSMDNGNTGGSKPSIYAPGEGSVPSQDNQPNEVLLPTTDVERNGLGVHSCPPT